MLKNCDCLDGLKELPDNSVDTLITDPPYGISFMGKDWDTFNKMDDLTKNGHGSVLHKKGFKKVPTQSSKHMMEFFTPIWKQCHRVLKPGSFAFIMCIPRQDCLSRMIVSLEDSGFNTNFTSLYWTFASGFPKSSNISKSIDKKLGAEREVTGKYQVPSDSNAGNAGKVIRTFRNSVFSGPTETGVNITSPSTQQAKHMDGWYTFNPKPAVEIIIVAQKQMKHKSYVDQALDYSNQVLQYQKNDIAPGCVNFDDTRIPYESEDDKIEGQSNRISKSKGMSFYSENDSDNFDRSDRNHIQGRFPSHLLVSDDVLNDGKEYDGGKRGFVNHYSPGYVYGFKKTVPTFNPGDSGSFSRYFSLDAWWNNKIKNLPESVQKTFPFLIVPKSSKSEKNKGCEGLNAKNPMRAPAPRDNEKEKTSTLHHNIHPTCKPLKLMSYLITLSTRENDTVLDPFLGSGTTAVACKMLGRKYIGFEISKEYYQIAKKRLQSCVTINDWI